jgi:hypothetical protein
MARSMIDGTRSPTSFRCLLYHRLCVGPAVVTDRPDPKFGLGSVWSIDLDPVYRPALTRLGLLGGVDELYNIAVDVTVAVAAICTV